MNEITEFDRKREDLTNQRTQLTDRVRELEGQLSRSIRGFEFDLAQKTFEQIIELQKIALVAQEVSSGFDKATSRPSYLSGSALLQEASIFLGQLRNESILYVAGNRFGNSYVFSQLIPPELDRSEPGYAVTRAESSLRKLGDLERHGSVLCAYFHMHPGRGSGSTLPSPVDLTSQRRLEKGGYPVIGGIFSRDGYLRFFSDQNPFEVSISGKGVEHVGKDLFKLAKIA